MKLRSRTTFATTGAVFVIAAGAGGALAGGDGGGGGPDTGTAIQAGGPEIARGRQRPGQVR
jgi:hypothetical protein